MAKMHTPSCVYNSVLLSDWCQIRQIRWQIPDFAESPAFQTFGDGETIHFLQVVWL